MKKSLKKFISVLLTLTMLMGAFGIVSVNADYLEEGGYKYTVANGEACLYHYDGTETEVTVPTSIGGYPVTQIYGTFSWCENITKITIPEGIKVVNVSTFQNCTNLKELVVADSVTVFSADFYGCTSLEKITLPEGLTELYGNLKNTPIYANEDNWENGGLYIGSYLVNVKSDYSGEFVVKDGTTLLAKYSVYGNKNITKISLPDSLLYICDGAIGDCSALTDITIPDSVISIGQNVFSNCSSLTEITIPSSVKNTGFGLFGNCTALTDVTIEGEISELSTYTFENCTSLVNVKLPDTLKVIGSEAFKDCSSLETLVIPEGVETISYNAFYRAYKLKNITFPSTLTTIELGALDGIYYFNDESNWDGNLLYINDILYKAKTSASGEVIIKDGVKSISESAFEDCSQITKVVIPDSIDTISSYAFSLCTSLSEVVFPENLKNIGGYAFNGCWALENIDLPDSVEFIGCNAFFGTAYASNDANWDGKLLYLENFLIQTKDEINGSVDVKDGTKAICDYVFSTNYDLSSIDIPDSVTYIGVQAFNECTSLSSIELPNALTSISEYTFWDCTSLRRVTIPVSVKTIECGAFSGCSSLSTIYYEGTKAQWNEIVIESGNDVLFGATIRCTDGNSGEPDPTPTPEITYILGSVDGNDTIDAKDALNVLKFAAKMGDFTEEQYMAADVNFDGTVNASDALKILQYAARIIDSFY